MSKMRTIKTSEIAATLVETPKGSEKAQKFGKIFEEEYTKNTWLVKKHSATTYSADYFRRKLAASLRNADLGKTWIKKGYRMYACLLKNNVIGRKPKTAFRKIKENVRVAGQPDLVEEYSEGGDIKERYFEFKTYPIDSYGRMQAEIFSWVLQHPIILVGLVEDEKGYISAVRETINHHATKTKRNILKGIKRVGLHA